ncbi:MAG: DUF2807 domain-containing protein [Maritimibacter sp.]
MRLAILSTAAVLTAGTAFAETRSFDIADFTRVDAGAGLNVEIAEGDQFLIEAEGAKAGIDRLVVERRGDTLKLSQKERNWLSGLSPIMDFFRDDEVAKVRVVLPSLAGVAVHSGADVLVSGASAASFEGSVSSGADLNITGVSASQVSLEANAGADMEISGSCETLQASASSGAKLDAADLICDTGSVSVSSGADIDLHASKVTAQASSGGSVELWGVDQVDANVSSGGEVRRH